jgi:L,D-peptidoglycan transpeptidase YkuD (ErfK/YbiS/YcfS/YnhG family)
MAMLRCDSIVSSFTPCCSNDETSCFEGRSFVSLKTMQFRVLAWLCPVILLAAPAWGQPEADGLRLPVEPRQMILVLTKDWRAVDGQLQRFERNGSAWQSIGPSVRVVVGRNGTGWGRGLHPMPQPGPQKKEGDGKSPAGVFGLSFVFGSEPPDKVPGIKMPYVQCTRTLECVDDPKSSHYNEILDRPSITEPDWHSSEHMLMTNGQYRLGVVIAHDTSPPIPGNGSCVFMHIWLGPGIGTSGCTAMRDGDIESLIGWLDVQANPMLVQLPEAEYLRLQKAWRLPEMPAPSTP